MALGGQIWQHAYDFENGAVQFHTRLSNLWYDDFAPCAEETAWFAGESMELLIYPPGGIGVASTVIGDGGQGDIDGQPNDSILFDSGAPAPNGFALPPGCSVSRIQGLVKLVGGSAVIGGGVAGNAIEVNLTDFVATRAAGAGGGDLRVVFQHRFVIPPLVPPFVVVTDDINGTIENPAGNVANALVEWQGYIDGVPITPPANAAVSNSGAGAPSPFRVTGSHGSLRRNIQLGQVELRGELKITLGAANDVFKLPTSADILVVWQDEKQQRIRA